MPEKTGLIFTDSFAISQKYGCEKSVIDSILSDYISSSKKVGIEWSLLDLGDGAYSYQLENDQSWRSHLSILDDYCYGTGMETGPEVGLFIIGGDDVIPMARLINTTYNERRKDREQYLDSDLPYAYPSSDIDCTPEGLLNKGGILKNAPRFIVGRLPLEDGELSSSPQEDIGNYFIRSIRDYSENSGLGLDVHNALMTSTSRNVRSSKEIVRKLPAKVQGDIPGFNGDVVTSPNLDLRDARTTKSYRKALSSSDLLLFILHGCPLPDGDPCYYGDYGTPAFSPECLNVSSAKVINAVCCWGAKYFDSLGEGFLSRENSMLLSSIYDKALLFAGSSRSVLGRFPSDQERLCVGFGETFLKYYTNYLFQGYDAGYAFHKAKMDYFCNFAPIDTEPLAWGTILMFNLFGNPLLHLKPQNRPGPVIVEGVPPRRYSYSAEGQIEKETVIPFMAKDSTGMLQATDLLTAIDSYIDKKIKGILSSVENTLGFTQDKVKDVSKFSYMGENGYIFQYEDCVYKGDNMSVKTDIEGNVIDVYCYY